MPLPAQNAVINPAADRRIKRIAFGYGMVFVALLFLTTFALAWANAKYGGPTLKSMMTPRLVMLNIASVLIVLIPFYAGIHRLYTARLEIGRECVAARAWGEAVAALDPFSAPLARFLDTGGEAHFLLAQAYTGLGDKQKAEKARAVVRRKKGVWADRLSAGRGSSVYTTQEKRPAPPKGKPRKRF